MPINWTKYRDDFPVTKRYAYLANAAISPIPVPVHNQLLIFFRQVLNHGGILWEEWITEMEETKDLYAKFIGADSSQEICFTHSTSEGMNIIAHMLSDKGFVLSNSLEFPSSNLPWINIDSKNIKFVNSTDGNKILLEDIEKMIDEGYDRTKTIITSHVQYSTGFRQDLVKLGELTRRKSLYLVVNPTQSLGAMNVNVKDFGIDFMTSNGHKWMLSSFGIGALFIRNKYLKDLGGFKPHFFSQSGQKAKENYGNNMKINMSLNASRYELGTPHFPNIIALKAAIKYISKINVEKIERRILELTDYLIERLLGLNLEILSPIEQKKYRSGIVIFRPIRKEPVDIVMELKKKKIIVSARGKGIRVSPHFYNNEDDIDRLVSALKVS
jgi:cysteine desulfurase/selenocysteine lyase